MLVILNVCDSRDFIFDYEMILMLSFSCLFLVIVLQVHARSNQNILFFFFGTNQNILLSRVKYISFKKELNTYINESKKIKIVRSLTFLINFRTSI